MKDYTLGETIDFKFTTCEPDTGAPATLSGTPVISAYVDNSTTQITAGITLSVDFDGVTGLNNVRVVATSGNGFAAGTNVALIITTGTVDSVSAVGYKVAEFSLGRPVTANVTQWLGTAAATPTTAGVPEVDVTHWLGTAAATPTTAGVPEVDVVAWHGSDLLTGTGPLAGLGVLDRGTAQSDSTTTLQLRSGAAFANDELIGATALIYSATTGAGQRGTISDYVSATDTATLSDALPTDPTGTVRYEIYGTAAGAAGGGATAQEVWEYSDRQLTALDEDVTTVDLNATTIGTVTNLTNKGDGSGFTAVPWNAAWDAEVQSEVADALAAYDPPTRTEATSDKDEILTAVGDLPTNAELATALAGADDAVLAAVATVDGNVDAIKAKTDSLTFTVSGTVDANITHVIGDAVQENGATDTNWGGAP